MIKILLLLISSVFFQACQVSPEVSSSKQVAPTSIPSNLDFSIILPTGGWKKLGDVLEISVTFPLPINVYGWPYINAKIGSTDRRFNYYSGDDSNTLLFRYTVQNTDLDSDGIVFYPTILKNGGRLTYSTDGINLTDLPTTLSLPEDATYPEIMTLSSSDPECTQDQPNPLCSVRQLKDSGYSSSLIKVDGVIPELSAMLDPAGGNYRTNQYLNYDLTFSEKVFVSGVPFFEVPLNSGDTPIEYRSGSGTKTLRFSRKIQAIDANVDPYINSTILDLDSSTITDQAGNSALPSVFGLITSSLLVNVTQPYIQSISPLPANATYIKGQSLSFTVNFSEPVNVTGTPALLLRLVTGKASAVYSSGSGTNQLIFTYTVPQNHVDMDGINILSPLVLNSGTIKNAAGTQQAALVIPTIPATPLINVNAATGPYVVLVTKPNDGLYAQAQNLDFVFSFSSLVVVNVAGGTPRVPIVIGSSTVYAAYVGGTGTNALTFRYTTTIADQDLDGISLKGPIELNGGTMKETSTSNDAILSYAAPSTTGIRVDGSAPVITSATCTNSGNLSANQYVYFSLKYSEAVSVTGTPQLTLDVGGNGRTATYYTGSGTNTLIFRYKILASENDPDGIDVNTPVDFNGGNIFDSNNNVADDAFASFNTSNIVVDSLGPSILSVTPPADATYNIGDNVDFVVQWSEPTYVSGNPRIALTVGSTILYATYLSGSGALDGNLTFRYTVLTNHLDVDGIVVTDDVQLNGGQIKDLLNNQTDLNFTAPLLPNVDIDGKAPFVTSVGIANGTYKAGSTLSFLVTWNEAIAITGTSPYLKVVIGTTEVNATLSASTATTATFTYTVLSGQLDTNGITLRSAIFLTAPDTIKDVYGNDSSLQVNPPDLTGVKVDAVIPTVLAIIPPADYTYNLGDNIEFQILWSEPITINTAGGTPRIAVEIGATTVYANYFAADSTSTKSVFRYTVVNTDTDADGISLPASSIGLNGGTIADAGTNNAIRTFTIPIMTGVLVDGVKPAITSVTANIANDTYGVGENLDFKICWSEDVFVIGTPYVGVKIGSETVNANYDSMFSSKCLIFRYTLVAGDIDSDGVDILSRVNVDVGSIRDGANNNVAQSFLPNVKNFTNIKVDAVLPKVTSVTSTNLTDSSKPDYFKPGQVIQYSLVFNRPVTVDTTPAAPRLVLNIGGATRYADYHAGSSTSTTKNFRFTIDSGSVLLDLDGIAVTQTVDMNGGGIEDLVSNTFNGNFSFSDKDYVYYSAIIARYHLKGSDYDTEDCNSEYDCITSVKDITGNGKKLEIGSGYGPKVLTDFGNVGTKSMKFNNNSLLKTTENMTSVKTVIFVMKTVTDASDTYTLSEHLLLKRKTYSSTQEAIKFTSVNTDAGMRKSILMEPNQKIKFNDGNYPGSHVATRTSETLWLNNTHYILSFEFSSAITFYDGTIIGGPSFNGQIAEIIFLANSSAITESDIDRIHTQLNAIHGVYP